MRTKRILFPLFVGLALSALPAAAVLTAGVTDQAHTTAGADAVPNVGNIKWDPGKTS